MFCSKGEEFIEEFSQLPSKTGKDVIDLEEYAKLPRVKTYEDIISFLEAARKSKEVRALFIVAEWGEGKTSVYEGLLRKSKVIRSDLVIPVSTKRLITFIKERSEEFTDTGSPGIRFFACLLYAIKDVIDNDLVQISPFDKIKIASKSKTDQTMKFILSGVKSIFNTINSESKVFIFLDEFEDLVDEPAEIQNFVRAGLVDVINGYPRCLSQDPYAGRFHLLIAATPPAYQRIKAAIYTDAGRLYGQRILDVNLEKLNRKDAYEYILGVLKYCWKGKLPKIPLCKPGMFNAIYSATLGNPRSIINVIELLLTHAKLYAPQGKIRIINPEQFISTLSGQKIQVYGGEINILSKESLSILYTKIEQKCEKMRISTEKCINFVHLLLSNPVPMSEEAIKKELGLRKNYSDYLRVIGASFNELWGIEPYIYFKKVIEGQDDVYSKAKSPKAPPNLFRVIDALEFYDYNSDKLSFVKVLFVPYRELGSMSFENRPVFQNFIDFFTGLSPELRSEDEIRNLVDRKVFDKVKKSEENYVMLSPSALNIFYPSPSIFFLDFIENIDKRFEVGMELMRNLTDFEAQFYKGILRLLEDGSRNVKIEKKFEPSGLKDVEVIDLSYSEIDQRYKIRGRTFSLLRLPETQVQDKIKKLMDEMKIACIPLLMVFSLNPLPSEVKEILETFFESRKEVEKIFHYLEFPLTTIHCHQVTGYIIALERNYKTNEEKWKARASRILDELKFEDELRRFIEEGIKKGYTIRPLHLDELKPSEVPGILRTLLVTEGNIEKRFKQICKFKEKFRVYGKDFPICPKDIESENALRRFIKDLSKNELIKESSKGLEINPTNVERRILAILREYGKPMQKDEIDKFFVSIISGGVTFKTDIYLNMLLERGLFKFNKKEGYYYLRGIEDLDSSFKRLNEELRKFKSRYSTFPYGYLFSIKQRNINGIIVKDCIVDLEKLAGSLEGLRYHPDYEKRRIRRFILYKLLMDQLRSIDALLSDFSRKLELTHEKVETFAIKRGLNNLEEQLNNLSLAEKRIEIKEKKQLFEKEKIVKELKNKVYSREELKELGKKLINDIRQFEGLYDHPRNCPVFDVKIIELAKALKDLQHFVNACNDKLSEIQSKESILINLRDSVLEHEIFRLEYSRKETPLSSIMLNWVLKNVQTQKR